MAERRFPTGGVGSIPSVRSPLRELSMRGSGLRCCGAPEPAPSRLRTRRNVPSLKPAAKRAQRCACQARPLSNVTERKL